MELVSLMIIQITKVSGTVIQMTVWEMKLDAHGYTTDVLKTVQ